MSLVKLPIPSTNFCPPGWPLLSSHSKLPDTGGLSNEVIIFLLDRDTRSVQSECGLWWLRLGEWAVTAPYPVSSSSASLSLERGRTKFSSGNRLCWEMTASVSMFPRYSVDRERGVTVSLPTDGEDTFISLHVCCDWNSFSKAFALESSSSTCVRCL